MCHYEFYVTDYTQYKRRSRYSNFYPKTKRCSSSKRTTPHIYYSNTVLKHFTHPDYTINQSIYFLFGVVHRKRGTNSSLNA